MKIRKQLDYIGQCLEELSSIGIEATDDVLYEPFYFYVSEKLVYNMKKTIPDIVIDIDQITGPFGIFKKISGLQKDLNSRKKKIDLLFLIN